MTIDEALASLKEIEGAKVRSFSDNFFIIYLKPETTAGVEVYKRAIGLQPENENGVEGRWGFAPVLYAGGPSPMIWLEDLEEAVNYIKSFIWHWGK